MPNTMLVHKDVVIKLHYDIMRCVLKSDRSLRYLPHAVCDKHFDITIREVLDSVGFIARNTDEYFIWDDGSTIKRLNRTFEGITSQGRDRHRY